MYCNRTLLKPPGEIQNVLFRKPNEKSAKTSLASHKSCEEMRGTDRLTASGRFSTLMFVFLWKKNQQCSFHPRLICQRSFHAIGIGNESWGRKQTRWLCNEQKKSKKRHCHEFIFFFLISSCSRAELIYKDQVCDIFREYAYNISKCSGLGNTCTGCQVDIFANLP